MSETISDADINKIIIDDCPDSDECPLRLFKVTSEKRYTNQLKALNELAKKHVIGRRLSCTTVPRTSKSFSKKFAGCPIRQEKVTNKLNIIRERKRKSTKMGKPSLSKEAVEASTSSTTNAKKRKIKNTINLKESDIIVNDIMELINKKNKELGKNYTNEVFAKLFDVQSESEMEYEIEETVNKNKSDENSNNNELNNQEIDYVNQANKRAKKTIKKNPVPAKVNNENNKNPKNNLIMNAPVNEQVKTNSQKRLPPIIVDSLNVHEFLQNNQSAKGNFSIKILKNEKKVITCTNTEARDTIIANLKEKKINAHTYQCSSERNVILLCYGIHFSVPEEIILAELKDKFGECIVNVKHHVTPRSKARNYNLDQHIINVKNTANIGEILANNSLAHHKVFIKKYVTKGAVQCLNCWSFGHTKTYCMRPFRCIKCINNHQPNECQKTEEEAPGCVNCKGAHSANYRGCPQNPSYRTITTHPSNDRNDATSRDRIVNHHIGSQATAAVTSSRIVSNKRPYNEILKNQTNLSDINNFPSLPSVGSARSSGVVGGDSPVNKILFEEPQRLFGMDIFVLMEKVTNFNDYYSKLPGKYEQQCAYIKFMQILINPVNG